MLKKVLITHDDLDGAGCRILFDLASWQQANGLDYSIINAHNTTIDQDTERVLNSSRVCKAMTEIWFADICATEPLLTRMRDEGWMVRIFDHHRTNFFAEDIYPETATIVPERNGKLESGTSLLHEWYIMNAMLTGKIYKRFSDLIRAYDTYEWKSTGNIMAKRMQTLFNLLGMERLCAFYIDYLYGAEDGWPLIPQKFDMFIDSRMEQEQEAIDKFIQEGRVTEIDVAGYKTAFIIGSRGSSISELAVQYLVAKPEFDIMVFYLPMENVFSFRTVKEGIDLGFLCKQIGGGGHPKAAGAPVGDDTIEEILQAFKKKLINIC